MSGRNPCEWVGALVTRSAAWVAGWSLLTGAGVHGQPLTNLPPLPWPREPLTIAECLNLAAEQNGTVAAARKDLEASEGVSIQTRAIVLPKLQASGNFTAYDDSST